MVDTQRWSRLSTRVTIIINGAALAGSLDSVFKFSRLLASPRRLDGQGWGDKDSTSGRGQTIFL